MTYHIRVTLEMQYIIEVPAASADEALAIADAIEHRDVWGMIQDDEPDKFRVVSAEVEDGNDE